MTREAAVAIALLNQNMESIVRRFNDPSDLSPYGFEPPIVSLINDSIGMLIDIRSEAEAIDAGGVML